MRKCSVTLRRGAAARVSGSRGFKVERAFSPCDVSSFVYSSAASFLFTRLTSVWALSSFRLVALSAFWLKRRVSHNSLLF